MSIAELELTTTSPLNVDEFPYETPVFHQCWWQFLASKFDIPVKSDDLLIVRKPILKGMVKLREARIAGWNNAWNQDLTPERVDELEELAHTSGWDYFRMCWTESRRHYQAFERLQQKGYPMLQRPAPVQYVVDMSDGFEGYLQGLSHNSRKSLKKKTRRGQALNPQLVPCTNAADIDAFFSELFLHHITYWDAKAGRSYFNDAEERNFIVGWAKTLHQSGQLVLERLVMGGETVNLSVGILAGSSFYWLLTVNTGLHNEYVPGIIGLYLRLEQLAAQGVTQFHMGAGDYFYKVQSANRQEACHDLIVCNPRSLKGKAYFYWLCRQKMSDHASSEA
ncbi:MAG: Acetyltransferase domain [Vampirovibrio sp.]|jgi:hypothetical protein|nr:Acetyltransferase domain [Vampirovibrio sp.]